jgi:hypothetical protein
MSKKKNNAVYIIINENRPMAIPASERGKEKPYVMYFSTKPTVFSDYQTARNVYRRQLRRYTSALEFKEMGRGWKDSVKGWMRDLTIVRVPTA